MAGCDLIDLLTELFVGLDTFSTKVTFMIAVLAFGLSLWTFIEIRLTNSIRISISAVQAAKSPSNVLLLMLFVNKSGKPISLTSCTLKHENGSNEVGAQVVNIKGVGANNIVPVAMKFPITLEPYGAVKCGMDSDEWQPSLPLKCVAAIRTSRGVVRKRIEIPTNIEMIRMIELLK